MHMCPRERLINRARGVPRAFNATVLYLQEQQEIVWAPLVHKQLYAWRYRKTTCLHRESPPSRIGRSYFNSSFKNQISRLFYKYNFIEAYARARVRKKKVVVRSAKIAKIRRNRADRDRAARSANRILPARSRFGIQR